MKRIPGLAVAFAVALAAAAAARPALAADAKASPYAARTLLMLARETP